MGIARRRSEAAGVGSKRQCRLRTCRRAGDSRCESGEPSELRGCLSSVPREIALRRGGRGGARARRRHSVRLGGVSRGRDRRRGLGNEVDIWRRGLVLRQWREEVLLLATIVACGGDAWRARERLRGR